MKKTLSIFLILFSLTLGFSQEQRLYSIKEIKEMPVFPSCEGIKSKRKEKVLECISREITLLMSKKMANFTQIMDAHNLSVAEAVLQFVISKEGIILNISATENSNPLLAAAAVNSLSLISEEIPPIRPAKLKSGENVNLFYQFPIRFTTTPSQEERIIYPVDEIVLFTLVQPEFSYEVRLFKERNLKVYEFNDREETFLGKFLSMQEFENSEPYKSLIEQERFEEKTLVTTGLINKDEYEIYIYNLFRRNKPSYVEVVKVTNKQKTVVATFQKEGDFSESEFAKLIYR